MSNQTEMIGVILAAGKGSRMYPFSERLPKPILPVLNRPLLAYHLDHMASVGIRRVIIVIGHYGFEIVRAVGDGSEWGIEIEYVDQEKTLGIAHALGCLEERIGSPFLLFLGDVFFNVKDLSPLVKTVLEGKSSGALAARREPDLEAMRRNFVIVEDKTGAVTRVIEKPSYPTTDLKGTGQYAFDLHMFDSVRRTPRTAARDEYEITDSIQLLIQDGFRVDAVDIIEEDINLTYPEDLLIANQRELKRQGLDRLIGKNFSGPKPENIERSVIGDNVTLPASVKVRDSIVMSDVIVSEARDLDHVIVTPGQSVPVDPFARFPGRDEQPGGS